MQEKHFRYMSSDHTTKIHAVVWVPDQEPVGLVQISHGMKEHIMRYSRFAAFLCEHGLVVAGNDHLGHGESVRSEDDLGYVAAKNGNRIHLSDMRELQRRMILEYPGLPFFLFGHSMGSFLARQYMCLYGRDLSGVVLSGTGNYSAAQAELGMLVCTLVAAVRGWSWRSKLVAGIAMGGYNRKFEPARTPSDWLTRDQSVVDAYIADPFTQYEYTVNGFYCLFQSLRFIARRANLEKIPRNLPVLLISGEMDPVGSFGLGTKRAAVGLHAAGVKDVTCRLYPNDRHEVLNELNSTEVFVDVLEWILRRSAEDRELSSTSEII